MLIRHIHAENFLSFGAGKAALDMDVEPGLNLMVGPNGAGKSNILRTLETVVGYFLAYGTYGQGRAVELAHRPTTPESRLKLACEVEWSIGEERALWGAFLIGALVPHEPWSSGWSPDPGAGTPKLPWDEARMTEYLDAVCHIDLSAAVDDITRQTLVVEIDPSTGSTELSCEIPSLELVYEVTEQYLRGRATDRLQSRPTVGLAELYVRAFPSEVRDGWQAYWQGQGSLPLLPPLDWHSLLAARQPGEFVNIQPFSGNYRPRTPRRPEQTWPLLTASPDMDSDKLRWGDMVRTLLREGFMRSEHWGIENPASWTLGTSIIEDLHRGRLGPALMTLASQGDRGRTAFSEICEDFEKVTGGTHLAYRVLPPRTPDADLRIAALWEQIANWSGQTDLEMPQGLHQERPRVQVVTDDDLPIEHAGSGRAQLAMLLTTLHLGGKVLSLDEPEQGLHPMLQSRMIRRWLGDASQTFVVTHSPYLLPPGGLKRVRYVALDPATGCSRVSPSESGTTVPDEILARFLRHQGDGLWLFSKVVVLVEGPNDVAAIQTWFEERPIAGGATSSDTGERQVSGVLFWSEGGKTAIMPMTRVLERFGIPWLALFDADTLSTAKNRVDDNKTVWEAWQDSGFLTDAPEDFEGRAWEDKLGLFPLSRVDDPSGPKIFLRGTKCNDNIDTLPEIEKFKTEAKKAVGRGPNMYRWIAEQSPSPDEFREMFDLLDHLASS